MNMNTIINMIMRLIMRKVINKGLDVGIKGASGMMRKRGQNPMRAQGEIDDYGNPVQQAGLSDQDRIRAERRAARKAARRNDRV